METTEKIVEAYVRYIKGWATIPNIKCQGQYEIDLLAIDPLTLERYHIETMITIAGGFEELIDAPYDPDLIKQKKHRARQRRTLGYFVECKFEPQEVRDKLVEYGFEDGGYKKIIVTWDVAKGVVKKAEESNIEIWLFPKLMRKIRKTVKGNSHYYPDDTIRTIHLFDKAIRKSPKKKKNNRKTAAAAAKGRR
jgi:hypothetical protein